MKEVLSQEEIDALLAALDTGEIDPELPQEDEDRSRFKSYDFRRPIKLSKEYISTLHMVFENFAKLASSQISTQVNASVTFNVEALEQISFEEFIKSIPNPTLIGIYHSKPLNGFQVIEINPQFSLQIVELVCGGVGMSEPQSKKDKFTDIELGILEDLVLNLLRTFKTSWSDIVEIETELDILETNPQQVQAISPNEPVVLISLSVEMFSAKSFIHICIPYVSFENITDRLSIRSWFEVNKPQENAVYRHYIEERLMVVDVDLTVELGTTAITIDDFIHLESGDVVRLDTKTNGAMKMYVEDKLHYMVQPGELDGRMAVQIQHYVEEDVER